MSGAWRLAAAATYALLALQWAWHWGEAPSQPPAWLLSVLWSLPLLPPAFAFLLRRPRAPLWAGIVALLYFCSGVAGLRGNAGVREWAETALSLLVVFAAGWPGIAAKLARRRAAPPPNV